MGFHNSNRKRVTIVTHKRGSHTTKGKNFVILMLQKVLQSKPLLKGLKYKGRNSPIVELSLISYLPSIFLLCVHWESKHISIFRLNYNTISLSYWIILWSIFFRDCKVVSLINLVPITTYHSCIHVLYGLFSFPSSSQGSNGFLSWAIQSHSMAAFFFNDKTLFLSSLSL